MTYVDEADTGVTSISVQRGEVLTLEIDNVTSFATRYPEQFEALLDCSAFVNWRRIECGDPPTNGASNRTR